MKREIVEVESLSISCAGESEVVGHPKIYLEIDPNKGEIDCPYCGRTFVAKNVKTGSSH